MVPFLSIVLWFVQIKCTKNKSLPKIISKYIANFSEDNQLAKRRPYISEDIPNF
jgi:hypothetical protein